MSDDVPLEPNLGEIHKAHSYTFAAGAGILDIWNLGGAFGRQFGPFVVITPFSRTNRLAAHYSKLIAVAGINAIVELHRNPEAHPTFRTTLNLNQ